MSTPGLFITTPIRIKQKARCRSVSLLSSGLDLCTEKSRRKDKRIREITQGDHSYEHEVILVGNVAVIAVLALFANNFILFFHELLSLLCLKLLNGLGECHA